MGRSSGSKNCSLTNVTRGCILSCKKGGEYYDFLG